MPRPALALGTWGEITTARDGAGYRARALYRDFDGVTRRVQKHGRSKGAAEQALRVALRDRARITSGGGDMVPTMKVSALAEAWWTDVGTRGLSPTTLESYRVRLDKMIIPSLGELRVHELSVGLLDRHLRAVTARNGPAAAKMVKTILSGMCGLAARNDILNRNLVRDTGTIPSGPKKTVRALTLAEARDLRTQVRFDQRAYDLDLADLIDFMLGTGCRIGEACAMTWDCIDFDAWTAEVRGTIIRLRGQGTLIKPSPKTKSGQRILELPSWCVEMLEKRRADHGRRAIAGTPVFTTTHGRLRDSSNTHADIRRLLDRTGYPWLSSHGFRKTAASLMDDARIPLRAIADQLGHADPSVTSRSYLGRTVRATGAAAVLEALG